MNQLEFKHENVESAIYYDIERFMDVKSDYGEDCPWKPETQERAWELLMKLAAGDTWHSPWSYLKLVPKEPAFVFVEIDGGFASYKANREDIVVIEYDYDKDKSHEFEVYTELPTMPIQAMLDFEVLKHPKRMLTDTFYTDGSYADLCKKYIH